MKPAFPLTALVLGLSVTCIRCSDDQAALTLRASARATAGFVVTLALDKSVYSVNSDILAHVSCRRSTGDWEAWTQPNFDSACNPEIQFRNTDGSPVDPGDLRHLGSPPFSECILVTARAVRPALQHIERGVVVSNDYVLNNHCESAPFLFGFSTGIGILRPGVYSAAAVWHLPTSDTEVDATVSSKPVELRIVAD